MLTKDLSNVYYVVAECSVYYINFPEILSQASQYYSSFEQQYPVVSCSFEEANLTNIDR